MERVARLRLLAGGKDVWKRAPSLKSARPRLGLSGPCRDHVADLFTAYKETECRLSRLLEDRSYFGRKLFEGVLQPLYAIRRDRYHIQERGNGQTGSVNEVAEYLGSQVNCLIREIRGMIREVESEMVEGCTLVADIKELRAFYEDDAGVSMAIDLQSSALGELNREEARVLFSILRDAVRNGVQHGQATQIAVSLRMEDGIMQFRVRDNSHSCELRSDRAWEHRLASMMGGANAIGGLLEIASLPAGGMQVTVTFGLLSDHELARSRGAEEAVVEMT